MLHSEQYESKSLLPSRLESLTSNLASYSMGNSYTSKNAPSANYSRLDNVAVRTVNVIENSSSLSRKRTSVIRSPDDEHRVISKRSFTFDPNHQPNTHRTNGIQKSTNTSDKVVLQPVMNTNSSSNSIRVTATVRASVSRENEDLVSSPVQNRSSQSHVTFQNQRSVAMAEAELLNLKDLVLMHLDLAKQQQETIMEKDRLIAELRTEALTLKTRLERMDRRLTIVKTPKAQTSLDIAGQSNVVGKNKFDKEDPSPCQQPKYDTKLVLDEKQTHKKRFNKRRNFKSDKLKIEQEKTDGLLRVKSVYFTEQVVEFQELTEETIPNKEETQLIEVPSFRIELYPSLNDSDLEEDIDDKTYLKRHQRHENEEKRRKRWDLQRLREVQMIEKLKQNQTNRTSQQLQKPDTLLDHLFPKAVSAQYIEICEELPVNVFGQAVCNFPPSEFSLPWFKPPLRNNKQKGCKTRGTKRRKAKR